MERIWTTLYFPPTVEEVSELSFSALKIIAYLQNVENFKAYIRNKHSLPNASEGGVYEDSREECNISPTYSLIEQHEEYIEHRPLDYKYDKQDCNDQNSTSKLNQSVDMFEVSLLSNKIFHFQTSKDINEYYNKIDAQPNKAITSLGTKITDYFPVKRKITDSTIDHYDRRKIISKINTPFQQLKSKSCSKQTILDPEGSSVHIECNDNSKIADSTITKKKMKQRKNHKNVQQDPTLLDFFQVPKTAFKTIKEFPEPTTSPMLKVKYDMPDNCTLSSDSYNSMYAQHNSSHLQDKCSSKLQSSAINQYCLSGYSNKETNDEVSLAEILHINKENIESVINIFSHKDLVEISFTIFYREGFCLLNKSVTKTKCNPNGILLCAKYLNDSFHFLFFSLECFKEEKLLSILFDILTSPTRKICCEAQTFMIFSLDNVGFENKRVCYDWCILDPLIAAWLLDPDNPPSSFHQLLNITLNFKETKQGKVQGMQNCCAYLKLQSLAMEFMYSQLLKEDLWKVFLHLETKVIPILAVLETSSLLVNVDILQKMKTILQEKLDQLYKEAEEHAGHKFCINSPLQIRKLLYDELKLDKATNITIKSTTIGRQKSTSESMLKLLGNIHPLPNIILEYRQLFKLKSAYIDNILSHTDENQCVSAMWDLCSAATGRITSNNPNMQAIPKRPVIVKIEGKEIEFNLRSCFEARKGFRFIAVDFKHIELRIFAHLAKDKRLCELLRKEGDIFSLMTQIRLKKEQISPDDRDQTKTLVYALMYGAGSSKLANILCISCQELDHVKKSFLEMFPSLRDFREKILKDVRISKQLKSLSGRKRIFPNILSENIVVRHTSERKAVNFIIQGSAADISKYMMLRTEKTLQEKKLFGNLMLQIHDELLWEVKDSDHINFISMLKEVMEDNKCYWKREFGIKIPLPVIITSGTNWGNME